MGRYKVDDYLDKCDVSVVKEFRRLGFRFRISEKYNTIIYDNRIIEDEGTWSVISFPVDRDYYEMKQWIYQDIDGDIRHRLSFGVNIDEKTHKAIDGQLKDLRIYRETVDKARS